MQILRQTLESEKNAVTLCDSAAFIKAELSQPNKAECNLGIIVFKKFGVY